MTCSAILVPLLWSVACVRCNRASARQKEDREAANEWQVEEAGRVHEAQLPGAAVRAQLHLGRRRRQPEQTPRDLQQLWHERKVHGGSEEEASGRLK